MANDDRFEYFLNSFCEDYAREKARDLRDYARNAATACESPIEELMVAAFCYTTTTELYFGGSDYINAVRSELGSLSLEEVLSMPITSAGIQLFPQVKIKNYRADFVVRVAHHCGGLAFGAIECDGHDHHNLTKEQAQRDRERDRVFQDSGLLILRYTGSEIWKSPLKCVMDALFIVAGKAYPTPAARWK